MYVPNPIIVAVALGELELQTSSLAIMTCPFLATMSCPRALEVSCRFHLDQKHQRYYMTDSDIRCRRRVTYSRRSVGPALPALKVQRCPPHVWGLREQKPLCKGANSRSRLARMAELSEQSPQQISCTNRSKPMGGSIPATWSTGPWQVLALV